MPKKSSGLLKTSIILPTKTPPIGGRVEPGKIPVNKKWVFSFKYWNQIEYFGLNKSSIKWFISLFEKLKELSAYDLDLFKTDSAARDHWRYHEINWRAKNIPIQRSHFTWLPKKYLENEQEYVFYQFQITKAFGRVVGFEDETHVFNILLLDPLHNIHPSNYTDYKLRSCAPLNCEYSELLSKVDKLRESILCNKKACEIRKELATLAQPNPHSNTLVIGLDDTELELVKTILAENSNLSLNKIFKDVLNRYLNNSE